MTSAIHLTAEDGAKSIKQVIAEQNGEEIPEQPIKSFHFLVDPFNDALIFPRVEGFQPEGFQWGILPGQDKKFNIPKIDIPASEGLDFFLVQTTGVCNFLLITEFF